jgi:hypothetical protein
MRSLRSVNIFRYYGKQFSVDNGYYKIVRIPKDKVTDYFTNKYYCCIIWDGGSNNTNSGGYSFIGGGWLYYMKSEVIKYIDDGIWVLI